MEVQGIRVCISPLACFDFERDFGGADEDRTRDLLTASQALSQLSYSPTLFLRCPAWAAGGSGHGVRGARSPR